MTSAVVKLGGSIVTDKRSAELRVREELVSRLGREIVEVGPSPLVIVHGAGSFGHQIVERTGLHEGLGGGATLFDLGETQRLQYDLDSAIARVLLGAGLPVMPCQPSASAVMRSRQLESMDVESIRLMVDRGAVPLLYGVPAMDLDQGCSILSGDQIAPYVASRLGIELIVHATDVDGVFESDPARDRSARRIDHIHRGNWDAVRERLGGSSAVDVTGGMAGKVGSLMRLAQKGLRSRIVDAREPGRVAAALRGEAVGTLICWGES